jgi:uncharacterized repeat protein (TIGR03803 family)
VRKGLKMRFSISRVMVIICLLILCQAVVHAQTLTTLASLDNSTGCCPLGSLTLSPDGSTLYGTPTGGPGTYGSGTIISIPVGGGPLTTLASFGGAGGSDPEGSLTLSPDGRTLYGMAMYGGTYNYGTIFSMPIGGGALTTMASFDGYNGAHPSLSRLTLSHDGQTLYGTTSSGGDKENSTLMGRGTIFSMPVGGGPITTLVNFYKTNILDPLGGLTISPDGTTLYGAAADGNASPSGIIYSVPVGGGSLTTLAAFDGNNGGAPRGNLMLSGSNLYGMTYQGGGYGYGTIFSVPVNGGTIKTLASFNGGNGRNPVGSLTLSSDGATLYGMTEYGGVNDMGTVFSIPIDDGPLTTLVSFSGLNGANPMGDLTLGTDGQTLYGMTAGGGPYNVQVFYPITGYGTVFSLAVPEPSSFVLMGIGGAAMLAWRPWRRRRT